MAILVPGRIGLPASSEAGFTETPQLAVLRRTLVALPASSEAGFTETRDARQSLSKPRRCCRPLRRLGSLRGDPRRSCRARAGGLPASSEAGFTETSMNTPHCTSDMWLPASSEAGFSETSASHRRRTSSDDVAGLFGSWVHRDGRARRLGRSQTPSPASSEARFTETQKRRLP